MAALTRDVARYEDWLRTRCEVVEADLAAKHERMRRSAFDFLRATCFRWARTLPELCPELAPAPRVLCVGDAHVENFGTWRDGDGRHVWGLNDFDEAAVLPYAHDLVRLAASARLAPKAGTEPGRAAEALLEGYVDGLGAPRPVLLDQGAPWFRGLVGALVDETPAFWAAWDASPDAVPPPDARRVLMKALPPGAVVERFVARRRGGGSLGRPRWQAIAHWRGGRVVREAKAVVPSAWDWASGAVKRLRLLDAAFGPHRAPDPSLEVVDGWLVRRIAPDSRKLDLKDVAGRGLGVTLLRAMGAELGALHAAHRRAPRILDDLAGRDPDWLHRAARVAAQAVERDYADWLQAGTPSTPSRRA